MSTLRKVALVGVAMGVIGATVADAAPIRATSPTSVGFDQGSGGISADNVQYRYRRRYYGRRYYGGPGPAVAAGAALGLLGAGIAAATAPAYGYGYGYPAYGYGRGYGYPGYGYYGY